MKFTADVASIVGIGDSSHWSQTHTTSSLFIVAQTLGENAAKRGNTFLKNIEARTSEITTSSLEVFKQFLLSCADDLSVLYVAVLIKNGILYAVVNGGTIWVKRGQKFAKLIESTGTLSGQIEINDIFFLAGESFVSVVDESVINKALIATSREIAESLAPLLHQHDTEHMAGAVVVRIVSDEQTTSHLPFKQITIISRLRIFLRNIKPLALVIVLLVLVLVGSVVFGISTQTKKKQLSSGQEILVTATHKYEEGIALIDLNPIRARALLSEAKTLLVTEGMSQHDKSLKTQIDQQLKKITEGINFALRSYEVTPDSFFQLDLIKSSAEGALMSLYQNSLAILDTKNGSLYTLTIDTKASRVVAGGSLLRSAVGVSVHGEDIYVFAQEVHKVKAAGTLKPIIENDSEWGGVQNIVAYGGNMYLLDTGKNQIWKYFGK